MVPVMVAGTLLHRRRYSALEYLCMSMIGVGVALFARKSSSTVTTKLAAPNAPLGYFLCFLNLSFDGVCGLSRLLHARSRPLLRSGFQQKHQRHGMPAAALLDA